MHQIRAELPPVRDVEYRCLPMHHVYPYFISFRNARVMRCYSTTTALILLTPALTASSFVMVNFPNTAVRATCGPPQNSKEYARANWGFSTVAPTGPTEYTETLSGYFALNSCSAPSFSASSLGITER